MWVFSLVVTFLLGLSAVTAQLSGDADDYIVWDDGDTVKNMTPTEEYFFPSDNDQFDTTIYREHTNGFAGQYEDSLEKHGNLSWDLTADEGSDENYHYLDFGSEQEDMTCLITIFDDPSDVDMLFYLEARDDVGTDISAVGLLDTVTENNWFFKPDGGRVDSGVSRVSGGNNITMHIAPSASYIAWYSDGVLLGNDTSSPDGVQQIRFRTDIRAQFQLDIQADNFRCWDGRPDNQPLIFQPPEISYGNFNNTRNDTVPLNLTFSVDRESLCIMSNATQVFSSETVQPSTNFNFTLGLGEVSLEQNFPLLNITCYEGSVLNLSATHFFNVTLDNIAPEITITSPSNEETINKNITSSLSLQISCIDYPVYRLNATITGPSNSQAASYESFTVIGGDTITLSESVDISDFEVGNYTLNVECADPHTENNIRTYFINKVIGNGSSKLQFDTRRSRIEIVYKGIAEEISYQKEKDRYSYSFQIDNPSRQSRQHTFEIISDKSVDYIENSEYNAHFVTGDNWIDFEMEGSYTYSIWRNGKGNYEVTVTTQEELLIFSSVGDLNVEQESIVFYIENVPLTVAPSGLLELGTCPFEQGTGSISFILFAFVIAFGLVAVGWILRHALISTIGSFVLGLISAYLYSCAVLVGFSLTMVSLLLMWYFIDAGSRGKL